MLIVELWGFVIFCISMRGFFTVVLGWRGGLVALHTEPVVARGYYASHHL